jgi:hypothetical protein
MLRYHNITHHIFKCSENGMIGTTSTEIVQSSTVSHEEVGGRRSEGPRSEGHSSVEFNVQ